MGPSCVYSQRDFMHKRPIDFESNLPLVTNYNCYIFAV